MADRNRKVPKGWTEEGFLRFASALGIPQEILGSPPTAERAIDRAPPVDPLDVQYDGMSLCTLLIRDRLRRWRETPHITFGTPRLFMPFTPAQRAALSAHWSAELRAKVAASEAERRAREPRVLVDLEEVL